MSSLYEHPPRVPFEQQRRLEDRAKAVHQALVGAGLPTSVVVEDHEVTGANVFVDTATGEMGGVFAKWEVNQSLISTATEALGAGRIDDPAVRHVGSVSLSMCDAILRILLSAGFTAQMADDDVRMMAVQILAAPGE